MLLRELLGNLRTQKDNHLNLFATDMLRSAVGWALPDLRQNRDNSLSKLQLQKETVMTVQELLAAAQNLSLRDQILLASQLMQCVAQETQSVSAENLDQSRTSDPLVDLFAGSPELATRSEEILQQEIGLNH
jgi:hypothetical protein